MKSTQTAAYKRFRAKLKAARLARGLTQKQSAARFGTYEAMICRMETGERRVDVIELHRLARIYRKPIAFFVDE